MTCNLTVMMAVLLLTVDTSSAEERLTVLKDPADPSRFACDITYATFTTPKDWRPNKSGNNTYAILTRQNETYPDVTQMISIDIGKPIDSTAKAAAESFASKWKGTVVKDTIDVDGVEGYRVLIPSDKKSLRPTDCIVIMNRDRIFFLIGGAKEDKVFDSTLTELVKSWKWKK